MHVARTLEPLAWPVLSARLSACCRNTAALPGFTIFATLTRHAMYLPLP